MSETDKERGAMSVQRSLTNGFQWNSLRGSATNPDRQAFSYSAASSGSCHLILFFEDAMRGYDVKAVCSGVQRRG